MNSYGNKGFNYFDQVRNEILAWMPEKVDKVFEIGCGSGATLSYIKERGIASWVGGMELVDGVAQEGKDNIDLLLVGNIEEADIPLDIASIDVILCLDVLEHLIDPWAAVAKLKKYLKEDGLVIASLPNVKNFKVILPLLFQDDWKYVEAGQLDRTHLRFFTNKTSVEFFKDANFEVIATPVFFSKKGNAGLVNSITLGLFRKFLQGNIFVVAKNII
jgi:2-polyprenyl-3-methyl-5-hydroxy-6-metoxy-1,4-benzoquinol methylase